MEWNRIKTMFIYLFTILNLLLITAYFYIDYQNKSERYEEKQAIINAMKNDNIIVEEPTLTKESLARVSANVKKFSLDTLNKNSSHIYTYTLAEGSNSEKLHIKFSAPLTNVNNSNYQDTLNSFISSNLNKNEQYVFGEYSISDRVIIYRQAIDGFKIYDNSKSIISFEVDTKGDVISSTQTALVNTKLDQEQMIVPYSQVVQKLYHENRIARNSKVALSLGYYSHVSQLQNQVLVPTWQIRVLTDDGKERTYYVDAINLRIIDK